MRKKLSILLLAIMLGFGYSNAQQNGRDKWTPAQAQDWYAKQRWLVGCVDEWSIKITMSQHPLLPQPSPSQHQSRSFRVFQRPQKL
jgi:hypothetical protein